MHIADQPYTTSQYHEKSRKVEAHHMNGVRKMIINTVKFSYLHILDGL